MIQFGGDFHVPRIGLIEGSRDYTVACNVPSPNFVATSPESLDERFLENLTPRLEIVEQPVPKFRFRYITEMKGPHGCLAGKSAKSTHQKTYPTVKLFNYYRDDAIIRCSLYTTNRSNPMPHAHALIATTDNQNRDEPHEKSVHAQNEYTAEFPGLGILHVPQKKLIPKLYEKLVQAYEEKFRRGPGSSLGPHQLAQALIKMREKVKQITEDEAKCMDKNQVALLFEAFRRDENGLLKPICEPVLSDPIQNQKSPKTNDLKICRIDKIEGLCTGGEEIYLLVEKVSKNNIQVHFVDKETGWQANAEFTQADVHHQYAIVCRTPPYQRQDITSEVGVQIALYRPSDQAISKSHTFTYKPKFPAIGKRSRSDNWNRNTTMKDTYRKKQKTSFEMQFPTKDLFQTTTYLNLLGNDLNHEDFTDFEKTYPSSSGRSISSSSDNGESTITDTEEYSLESLLENFVPESVLFDQNTDFTPVNHGAIATDGTLPEVSSKDNKAGSSEVPKTTDKSKSLAENLDQKQSFENTKVEDVAQKLADIQIQDDAKASQECFEDAKCKNKCITLMEARIKELVEAANEKALLLMLAASNSSAELQHLLAVGVRDVNARDESKGTALHWAVRCGSTDCMRALLKCSDIDLNAADSDGRTPLHMAVDQNDCEAIEALIEAGADVTIPNAKTGDTVLHTAVKWNQTSVIILLLQTGKFTLEEENYKEISVKTMVNQSKDQDLRALFTFAANTCALNTESSSDGSSSDNTDEDEDRNFDAIS